MTEQPAADAAPRACDLLVCGDYALQPDVTLAADVAWAVCHGRLVEMGPREVMEHRYRPQRRLGGAGKLILPGFIDSHTHAAQQLVRGRIVDQLPMVWARILVPYESRLTAEEVYAGSLLCCLQMIRNGFTSFIEAGGPHADQIARAAHEAGLRAVVCRSTMDTGDIAPPGMRDADPEQAVAATRQLRRQWDGAGEGRVRVWYAIRQIMTSTPQLIQAMARSAQEDGAGLHLHLAEYSVEVQHCLVHYGQRPVQWLADLGVLGENVLAAHAILITDAEAGLLAEHGVRVVHCPPTNMSNNGAGKTPLLQQLGVPVALGSDGAAHHGIDPFRLMQLAKYWLQLIHGLAVNDPLAAPVRRVLQMATQGGAAALQMEDQVGALEVGKRADLILLDYRRADLWPTHDLLESVVLSGSGATVSDVVVDGRVLLEEGRLLSLDEAAVVQEAAGRLRAIARRLGWE